MKKNPLGLGFRVTQSLLLKPDYYKSLPPSQLLDQRGFDIIVINPGSANVHIGHASSKAPITVPHCIAHHLWINDKKEGSAKRNSQAQLARNGLGLHCYRQQDVMNAKTFLRWNPEMSWWDFQVCSQLKLPTSLPETGKRGQAGTMGGDKFSLVPQNEDTFSWTQVEDESDLVMPATLKQSLSKSSPKGTPTGEKGEPGIVRPYGGPLMETAALPNTHDVTENGMAMEEDKRSKPFRRNMHLPEPRYQLSSPVLNWVWGNIIDVIVGSILLWVGRLSHTVLHGQECVAATFGNGVSSGCIVNMGHENNAGDKVRVLLCMGLQEGVAIPTTRSVLSFGGDDITRRLLWVQQQRQTWPHIDSDPLHDPLDFQTLNNLKETHCSMREYEQRVATEIRCCTAGEPTRVYKVSLSALNVPAEGLFYPSLLAPEEYSALMRPWYHVDHEDVADDSLQEANKRNEAMEPGFVNGNLNGAYVSAGNAEGFPANSEDNMRDRVEELSIGLQQCIVNSILSIGRMDLQKKLFASIQLVGGVALTKGLVDAIEERVLHTIPAHESVDTVEVLPNRMDPSTAMWRGGAVLAVLDSGRDLWVQYEDWMDGGVGVGTGRKYRDSNTLHSQAFWYNAMLD
ncbi:unnamed protein product [Sphagnum troendelagicum]|uniref:Actin-related protein 8 n=1 Tax=Sphagnum troendelagicum TaxID=128251 RepID=A0ABP0TQI9_9BRYO